jgi:hypothetical protein
MEDTGIDLPAGSGLQPVRARQEQDAVVSLAPVLETAPHVVFRRARLEPHEGKRKRIFNLVVLRRKVIRLGLAFLPDELCERVALVEVMGNRAHVVEELAEEVPSAFALHRRRAEQQIAAFVDKRLEQHTPAVLHPHVAEPFVVGSARSIRRARRRREPPFVDAAPMRAERVEIVGMQPEPPAGNHEGARHPARFEPENAGTRVDCVLCACASGSSLGRHRALVSRSEPV